STVMPYTTLFRSLDPRCDMHDDGGRRGVVDREANRVCLRVRDAIEREAAIRRVEIARCDEGEGLWTDRDVRPDHLNGPVADHGGLPDHGLFHVRAVEAAAREGLGLRERREMIPAVHGPVRSGHLQI